MANFPNRKVDYIQILRQGCGENGSEHFLRPLDRILHVEGTFKSQVARAQRQVDYRPRPFPELEHFSERMMYPAGQRHKRSDYAPLVYRLNTYTALRLTLVNYPGKSQVREVSCCRRVSLTSHKSESEHLLPQW